jgi:DNA (cytosine-5)-methyltransferase 1
MNELSLFSGAGGGLLGTKLLDWRTVGYVENNTYCQQILAQRIKDGFLDEAPIFGDINGFIESGAVDEYKGITDVVSGGFPCQPFSVAGKQAGEDDPRNMWPQTIEVIRRVRPRFAFLENVPGLLSHGYIRRIFGDLAEAGFNARWTVLGADDVGAPHRRKRLWILADSKLYGRDHPKERSHKDGTQGQLGKGNEHRETVRNGPLQNVADSNSPREQQPTRYNKESRRWSGDSGEDVADSDSTGLSQRRWSESVEKEYTRAECGSERQSQSSWPTEPELGRVAHGVAHRVDRIKAIGNGQVPRVVAAAWRILNDSDGAVTKKTT